LETVDEGLTGAFFREYSAEAFLDALRRCDAIDATPEMLAEQARRFSRGAFRDRLRAVLEEATSRPSTETLPPEGVFAQS
jgi:hypothetical protein